MQQHAASPNDSNASIENERRESERRSPLVEPTFVWVSLDRRIKARIHDVSNGGISIIVDERDPFEVDFKLRVELGIHRFSATVAHIRKFEPGGYCIGLTWEKS